MTKDACYSKEKQKNPNIWSITIQGGSPEKSTTPLHKGLQNGGAENKGTGISS